MENLFDEFSKSLADSVPRRESLRRLGAVFAGAVLSPLGLETVWAGKVDPCKAFCKCRNGIQQNQCLAACRACANNPSQLCGTCGGYTCCAEGANCCSGHCTNLAGDIDNCGACGAACDAPLPGEVVACISGTCVYDCAPDALDCNGTCTFLDSDPDNCGACGNVCPESAPYCLDGVCRQSPCSPSYLTLCGGVCVNLKTDWANCGACGHECIGFDACIGSVCENFWPNDPGY